MSGFALIFFFFLGRGSRFEKHFHYFYFKSSVHFKRVLALGKCLDSIQADPPRARGHEVGSMMVSEL